MLRSVSARCPRSCHEYPCGNYFSGDIRGVTVGSSSKAAMFMWSCWSPVLTKGLRKAIFASFGETTGSPRLRMKKYSRESTCSGVSFSPPSKDVILLAASLAVWVAEPSHTLCLSGSGLVNRKARPNLSHSVSFIVSKSVGTHCNCIFDCCRL